MLIRVKDDGTTVYPYSLRDLRRDFKDVSFPASMPSALLQAFGVFDVVTITPTYSEATQTVFGPTVVFNNELQRWEAQWGVRDKTPEEVVASTPVFIDVIVALTQTRLDDFAKTRGYDDIKSASDYAGCSVPKFDVEGRYCRDARAETWAKLYEILGQVESGARPMPASFEEIEPELPALSWPLP